jgi:hypothetical protein
MGYLTTITLYNDALHEFQKDPAGFAEALFDGINHANNRHREVSVPFHSHANYISVQPSRHADDDTLYIHTGNCVVQINKYDENFVAFIDHNPALALDFIKRAQRLLTEARKTIKIQKP